MNNTFKPNLIEKFSRIEVHNVLALPIVYMKMKFGPLEKRIENE